MAKFSLITFKITNGDYEHYEYSFYELKNRAGVSDKEIIQDFIGSEDVVLILLICHLFLQESTSYPRIKAHHLCS